MIAKDLQHTGLTFNGKCGFTIVDGMERHLVWLIADIGAFVRFYQFLQHLIGFVIDQNAARFYLLNENGELLEVEIEGWKNIYMVPGNAG